MIENNTPYTKSLSKQNGKGKTYESGPMKFRHRIQSMKTYQEEIYNFPNTKKEKYGKQSRK